MPGTHSSPWTQPERCALSLVRSVHLGVSFICSFQCVSFVSFEHNFRILSFVTLLCVVVSTLCGGSLDLQKTNRRLPQTINSSRKVVMWTFADAVEDKQTLLVDNFHALSHVQPECASVESFEVILVLRQSVNSNFFEPAVRP